MSFLFTTPTIAGSKVSPTRRSSRPRSPRNVRSSRRTCRLEDDALSRGEAHAVLVFTSNRQFPRGEPATIGRLVKALDALLTGSPTLEHSLFLARSPSR
jgi:hypothetical protein